MIGVTGIGLVTGLGATTHEFWDGLLAGRFAFEAPLRSKRTSRRSTLLRAAWREALTSASLSALPARSLVVFGGQTPRLHASAPADAAEFPGPWEDVDELLARDTEVAFVSQACASIAFGIAYSRDWLLAGAGEIAVVAAGSAANAHQHAGMNAVRAISPTRPRPFDVRRDGIAIGEGAGVVVLEALASARRRGAAPLAVLKGIGCRTGGDTTTDSDSTAIAETIASALDEADCASVDYVHAHATGTLQGDAAELAALESVAEAREWKRMPASASKGAVGHLLHGAAVPGLVAALGTLRTGRAPGTPGSREVEATQRIRLLVTPDDLPGARTALVNCFGFGGNNAALVVAATGGAG